MSFGTVSLAASAGVMRKKGRPETGGQVRDLDMRWGRKGRRGGGIGERGRESGREGNGEGRKGEQRGAEREGRVAKEYSDPCEGASQRWGRGEEGKGRREQ